MLTSMMGMLAMTVGEGLLAWTLTLVCGLLIVVVLLQRGRGGGLVGVFGGAGGAGSAFGAKTGDVFTWITVGLALLFLLLSSMGNCILDQSGTTPQPALTGLEPLGEPDADTAAPPPGAGQSPPAPQSPTSPPSVPSDNGGDRNPAPSTGAEAPADPAAKDTVPQPPGGTQESPSP